MKRGLMLPGYACKSWIWQHIKEGLEPSYNFKIIDWPVKLISNFNSLTDYAKWVREEYIKVDEEYDFIIGHSMGGAVALHIAGMESIKVNKVVLVESFVTPPQKFFQNLLMADTDSRLGVQVDNMLKEEQKLYCKDIRDKLRNLDLGELVLKLESEVIAIYGDRGCNDSSKVLSELKWNEKIKSKIDFNTIYNACHFPMLENSDDLLKFLKDVL